jgi:5-methylcytosine-specific restriction endonuclease McrA
VTSITKATDNPIRNVSDVQPLASKYNDEIYLSNRLLAFEREGWKCTKCGSREKLQAHHIEPISQGVIDLKVVHRVENLITLCAMCHRKLSATSYGSFGLGS